MLVGLELFFNHYFQMHEDWIKDEFKNLSLGDKRLNDRFIKTMTLFSERPEDCINRAITDAAAKKAAYRFFSNTDCSTDKILKCHTDQTKLRMQDYKVVLSIHDSSYFGYSSKNSIEGLGNIGGRSTDLDGNETTGKGFIGHFALAVSEDGLPLGLQGAKFWSRAYDTPWDKESERWSELSDQAEDLYGKDTKMIYIADREADHFELLYQNQVDQIDFVIRSKTDRLVQGKSHYLNWELANKESTTIKFYVPARKKEIEASLKFGEVSFNDPKINRAKQLSRRGIREVNLKVVEVKELGKTSKDSLRWVLFTTLDVKSVDDALRIVHYYRQRWHIENYFKVLKGGCCKVENSSLRTYERLERYVAAFSILSWRLYWARHINTVDPDAPAEMILSPIEIEVIRIRIDKRNQGPGRKKILPHIETVRDAIRYIASLGGFNGRKGDGEPGIMTIWRGFIRLQDKAEMLEEMYQVGKLN
jgi:hypothetical protein